MNKRIRELALLSGQNLIPFMDPRVKDMISERFAELIVQECAGLCSDPVVVLQHFGIDSKSE